MTTSHSRRAPRPHLPCSADHGSTYPLIRAGYVYTWLNLTPRGDRGVLLKDFLLTLLTDDVQQEVLPQAGLHPLPPAILERSRTIAESLLVAAPNLRDGHPAG